MKVQRENLRLTAEQWTVKVCARHVTYARTAPLELLRRPTQRFMSNSCISPHNTEAQKPERRFTPDLSNLYNSDRGGQFGKGLILLPHQQMLGTERTAPR